MLSEVLLSVIEDGDDGVAHDNDGEAE